MEIISNPTQDEIVRAAKVLKDGHLVAFPTETVYGLGADATNEKAVSRIYSVKGRPNHHPLIVHISSIGQLDKWAVDIPKYAIKLAKEFWPGPMTLILKRSDLAKDFITGGQDNIGLRVPSQPVAIRLLSEFEKIGGQGIAAPSANRFGAVSPTSANSVVACLDEFSISTDLVLDGGECSIGIESTIIDCTHQIPSVLRPGEITMKRISDLLGLNVEYAYSTKKRVSGRSDSHYAPKATVILDQIPQPGDGLIALSNIETPDGVFRIASPENDDQFARILYSSLQKADTLKLARIIVIQPQNEGIAFAIRERLSKAANIQFYKS
jgi:L-threonylcarbamoyladenylate synthase